MYEKIRVKIFKVGRVSVYECVGEKRMKARNEEGYFVRRKKKKLIVRRKNGNKYSQWGLREARKSGCFPLDGGLLLTGCG